MPNEQSQSTFQALQQTASIYPFVWAYEIEVPTDPPTRYRFVGRYTTSIEFRGNTYYPFPVTHSELGENSEGDLSESSLTVGNITRELVTVLSAHRGLVGQTVRIMLLNSADLLGGRSVVERDFTIRNTELEAEVITAKLAIYDLYRTYFPKRRAMRGHCAHRYRGTGCGYSVAVADGGLATCDQSFDGPNGCGVHGASELAAGVEVLHPKRMLAFLGIPRRQVGGSL